MPVVPFAQVPAPTPQRGPIKLAAADEPWALMAAAQMHEEGRLIGAPTSSNTTDTRDASRSDL